MDIAVLIAILLPALNAARAAAQTTMCLSNMRQIAIAVNGYASANQNILPYHPSDTWICFEHANSDITPSTCVFRHPKLSCNFAYLDGHVETLHVGDVDGILDWYSSTVAGIWDQREDLNN